MSSPLDETQSPKTTTYNQQASEGDNFNGRVSGGVNTYGGSGNTHSEMQVTRPHITGNTLNANLVINGISVLQIIRAIFAFFQSDENRRVLNHPLPGSDEGGGAGAAAAVPINFKVDDALVREDPDAEDETSGGGEDESSGTGGKQHDGRTDSDYDVSSLDDLDLRSIQAKTATNAEIYTRLMLKCCNHGLACWHPRPFDGTDEIRLGDVGRFNLTNGFEKLFNVWDHERAGSWQTPGTKATRRRSDYLPEGYTVVNGASSTIRRSPDREYIRTFEFSRTSEEGAVLACTTSADLEELEDPDSLRDFLIQHAGVLYQHATSMKHLAEGSLYIVTGCVKTASWALAAYQKAPADQVLKLKKWFPGNTTTDRGKLYDWVKRGTAETPHWPTTPTEARSSGEKTHTLFLKGFKLAFSSKFRARMKGLQLKAMGEESMRMGHDGDDRVSRGNLSESGGSQSTFPASSLPMHERTTSFSSDIQVYSFPDVAKTPLVHPCDTITSLLLEVTGADCALSHDDDWRHRPDTDNSSCGRVARLLPTHTDDLVDRTGGPNLGKAPGPHVETGLDVHQNPKDVNIRNMGFFKNAQNFTMGNVQFNTTQGDYYDNSTRNVRNTYGDRNRYYTNNKIRYYNNSTNYNGDYHAPATHHHGPVNNVGPANNVISGGFVNQSKMRDYNQFDGPVPHPDDPYPPPGPPPVQGRRPGPRPYNQHFTATEPVVPQHEGFPQRRGPPRPNLPHLPESDDGAYQDWGQQQGPPPAFPPMGVQGYPQHPQDPSYRPMGAPSGPLQQQRQRPQQQWQGPEEWPGQHAYNRGMAQLRNNSPDPDSWDVAGSGESDSSDYSDSDEEIPSIEFSQCRDLASGG